MAGDFPETAGTGACPDLDEIEARSRHAGFRSVDSIVAGLLERCERRMARLRDDGSAWPVAQASRAGGVEGHDAAARPARRKVWNAL